MPKVELTKIRLAVTAVTKTIIATIPSKDGTTALHKHDVTSDFLKCIIDYGKNSRFNIDKDYEVACIEKKGYKRVIYSRTEAIELLADAVRDGVGEKISVEEWAKEKLL